MLICAHRYSGDPRQEVFGEHQEGRDPRAARGLRDSETTAPWTMQRFLVAHLSLEHSLGPLELPCEVKVRHLHSLQLSPQSGDAICLLVLTMDNRLQKSNARKKANYIIYPSKAV